MPGCPPLNAASQLMRRNNAQTPGLQFSLHVGYPFLGE